MAEIKPAEVSAILRQQLSGFHSEAELAETGTVLEVGRRNCTCIWFKQSSIG